MSKEINHQIDAKIVLRDLVKIGAICSVIGSLIFIFYKQILEKWIDQYIHSLLLQNLIGLIIVVIIAGILYLGIVGFIGPKAIKGGLRKLFIRVQS